MPNLHVTDCQVMLYMTRSQHHDQVRSRLDRLGRRPAAQRRLPDDGRITGSGLDP